MGQRQSRFRSQKDKFSQNSILTRFRAKYSSASNVKDVGYEIYKYFALQPEQIRLLELLPINSYDERLHRVVEPYIRCRILTVDFRAAPEYEALSYTWGTPIQACPIFISNSLSTSEGVNKKKLFLLQATSYPR